MQTPEKLLLTTLTRPMRILSGMRLANQNQCYKRFLRPFEMNHFAPGAAFGILHAGYSSYANTPTIRPRMRNTYNRRDSLVVTHPTTNLPACGLSTAERTGSPVFHTLWSAKVKNTKLSDNALKVVVVPL
ncbi:hypothetical protein BO79DRAFT_218343 [Aspergillus costaricaensis CBS 115574]|uniref:Uncharacterized protein n=1 Tax=Aspergillus costaricaensis CBS 115574 TaxID=1448317 RepID=A0ACD1ICJ1_9EURO|nr:hypothetical protein BO79DRAFT_218343 [Aspergillus costaricaensis CBS 115574]RAK87994.1 hypothetical protein BO79DRAFT_218343 [Aspergillus costaricaensis CBS 115574]